MSMNNGGPAFPVKIQVNDGGFDFDGVLYEKETEISYSGMTLRDYFAAKAMQGVIVNEADNDVSEESVCSAIATLSYRIADAMLAEREKGGAK